MKRNAPSGTGNRDWEGKNKKKKKKGNKTEKNLSNETALQRSFHAIIYLCSNVADSSAFENKQYYVQA